MVYCEQCKFWKSSNTKGKRGTCCRKSPSVIPLVAFNKSVAETVWPKTYSYEQCGEGESK